MAKKYTKEEMKQLDQFAACIFAQVGVHRDEAVNRARIQQAYSVAMMMLEESKAVACLEA